MEWIKKRTHIIDHERFLAAGPLARDLYDWGMLYAGKHETDGAIPMVAVLKSAWGHGSKLNAKLSETLVEVGLWSRTATGFLILRWAEQGNQTKAHIAAERQAARVRMAGKRISNVRANIDRTSPDVPTSTSTSLSVSCSDLRSPSTTPLADPPPDEGSGVHHRLVGPDGDSGTVFAAYAAGVRAVTGRPMTALQVADRKALVAMINAHADLGDGEVVEAWVRSTASAFARQHDANFGGYSPSMCAKWLDGGRRERNGAPPRQQLGAAANAPWMKPQAFDFGGDK